MSKAVKTIASVALPIIGTLVAPGIGTYLGSTLSSGTLGAIGGALGGAAGGAISGGNVLQSAALGGVGGYVGAGGAGGAATTAGTGAATAAGTTSEALLAAGAGAAPGFSPAISTAAGSSLGSTIGNSLVAGAKNLVSEPSKLLGVGNQLIAAGQAEAATEAAGVQRDAANQAISGYLSPYNKLGTAAAQQIQDIQADPTGYIQGNELYGTLAADAEQRLLANQAAKGKIASGGTASALQSELLGIGSGLVNQEVNTLQGQVNTGLSSATGSSNLATQASNAEAAGIIGSSNALASGYQNQLSTMLALQSLQGSPTYQAANI